MDRRWCLGILIFSSLALSRESAMVGSVTFKARTQLFGFSGTSKEVTASHKVDPDGKFQGVGGLPLQTLDTGIESRNKHMLEDLGASGNPVAAMRYEGTGEKFSGELTLNGITQKISGTVSRRAPLEFLFPLRLSDFKIPRRSQLGMKVQDEIEVTVQVQEK